MRRLYASVRVLRSCLFRSPRLGNEAGINLRGRVGVETERTSVFNEGEMVEHSEVVEGYLKWFDNSRGPNRVV